MSANIVPLCAPHWLFARDMGQLVNIQDAGLTIAVVERSVPTEVEMATRNLLGTPEMRQVALLGVPGETFRHHLTRLIPAVAGLDALVEDLDWLAAALLLLSGAHAVGLRLQRVDRLPPASFAALDDALQLVCCYGGTGHEWLPNGTMVRNGREQPGSVSRYDEARAFRLPAYAVGVLKGERWPGNAGNGIVTRPPGGSAPEPGLLLTVVAI